MRMNFLPILEFISETYVKNIVEDFHVNYKTMDLEFKILSEIFLSRI